MSEAYARLQHMVVEHCFTIGLCTWDDGMCELFLEGYGDRFMGSDLEDCIQQAYAWHVYDSEVHNEKQK